MGTSIGAGMLGLPVETGKGGFFPSIIFLMLNWAVMTGTALLLIEVLAHSKHNANFVSLTEKLLGPYFKVITFFVYIVLFMSLTLAYVKGGGGFLSSVFLNMPISLGCLIFLVLLVPLIILGSKVLSFGNDFLTFGLVISFLALIAIGVTKIQPSFLMRIDFVSASLSLPMYLTAFGFQGTLPSLYSYLGCKKSLKTAVIIGTTVTLAIYVVWQLVIMGIIPLYGVHSLSSALSADQTAITPLEFYVRSPLLGVCARIFYFTAITTSFLGVGLGLIDFLLDSFKMKQRFVNRLFLAILIYMPALYIAQTDYRIFYLSLKYGGGISCLYLLVILPLLLFKKVNKRF